MAAYAVRDSMALAAPQNLLVTPLHLCISIEARVSADAGEMLLPSARNGGTCQFCMCLTAASNLSRDRLEYWRGAEPVCTGEAVSKGVDCLGLSALSCRSSCGRGGADDYDLQRTMFVPFLRSR